MEGGAVHRCDVLVMQHESAVETVPGVDNTAVNAPIQGACPLSDAHSVLSPPYLLTCSVRKKTK